MNHDEYTEMLALEAIAALDDAEREALQKHLATCPECRRELVEWRDTAAQLALAIEPVAPPSELRANILARLSENSPSSQASGMRGADARSDHDPVEENGKVLPLRRPEKTADQRFFLSKSAFWSGALAASLAILALTIALVALWNRETKVREQLAHERSTREFLSAPDAHIAQLTGTSVAPHARAKLAFDSRTGHALFFAYDLPPAPAGKAYQIWFIAGGKPIPGKVFMTDAAGRAELEEQIPAAGRNASIFAVTIEPAHGENSPTGEKYLLSTPS
ncbi:MAG: anti-sigma factor domain-containing protein [Pyrinomonadaceae bacterium]